MTARTVWEAAVAAALTTKQSTVLTSQGQKGSDYVAAAAAYNGTAAQYATYKAAIALADANHQARVDAASQAAQQAITQAENAYVTSTGLPSNGF